MPENTGDNGKKSKESIDPVLQRISDLLKAQGKQEKELIQYIGLGRGTFTAWRYRGVKTYTQHIDEIAEFLDVSPNYLIRGEDGEIGVETLSEAEIWLIKTYRAADDVGKSHLRQTAKYIEMATDEN
ncbi:MAG: hypothetical protein IJ058_14540 [Lachnospiraceae bacterium]|nr:hypothetical protein [Lachnospiraceae bacterium]MBQ8948000.1 hypothetical protein [Lachnospiraceae bacterium]